MTIDANLFLKDFGTQAFILPTITAHEWESYPILLRYLEGKTSNHAVQGLYEHARSEWFRLSGCLSEGKARPYEILLNGNAKIVRWHEYAIMRGYIKNDALMRERDFGFDEVVWGKLVNTLSTQHGTSVWSCQDVDSADFFRTWRSFHHPYAWPKEYRMITVSDVTPGCAPMAVAPSWDNLPIVEKYDFIDAYREEEPKISFEDDYYDMSLESELGDDGAEAFWLNTKGE